MRVRSVPLGVAALAAAGGFIGLWFASRSLQETEAERSRPSPVSRVGEPAPAPVPDAALIDKLRREAEQREVERQEAERKEAVRQWKFGGKETARLEGHTGWVFSVAFSPDGAKVASGSGDNTVRLWDARTGKETARLEGHTGTVYSVAFSPDGSRLASGSDDKTVRLWDAVTGE
ncbi:MAG: hypothetical protein HY719_11175 [Planctomycetes bacterium]|nr:hypothetical protein [Planctomycetota bacterium]